MLLYHDFVKTLAGRCETAFDSIKVGYNFDYGPEFEITLGEVLRSALPDQYGVVRGFAVNSEGTTAGDDILIFARDRFPTLALRDRDKSERKEFIPIEATYCYIEAKHSLHIEGSGPQSLSHACEQVSKVKALCATRKPVPPSQIGRYLKATNGISANIPPEFPPIMNPSFGIVFSRKVRQKQNSEICESGADVQKFLEGFSFASDYPPDLIVLGDSLVVIPTLQATTQDKRYYRSPFFIENQSIYCTKVVDKLAFGIGLATILSALDYIQLGVLPWHRVIVNALGIQDS